MEGQKGKGDPPSIYECITVCISKRACRALARKLWRLARRMQWQQMPVKLRCHMGSRNFVSVTVRTCLPNTLSLFRKEKKRKEKKEKSTPLGVMTGASVIIH